MKIFLRIYYSSSYFWALLNRGTTLGHSQPPATSYNFADTTHDHPGPAVILPTPFTTRHNVATTTLEQP